MKKLILLCCAINVITLSFAQLNWQNFPYTPAGSVLSFPDDDGKHTNVNYYTEWWYMNMHLVGSAPEFKQYDVMLCYFSKPATMRIFNIADPVSGKYHIDVNKTPFVFSQYEKYWQLDYTIPSLISDQSKWTYPNDSIPFSYSYYAENPSKGDVLDVVVTSNRPPLIVGGDGFVPLGEQGDSSYYYSYSNMQVKGTITFDGIFDSISSGIAWIDRQWGPFIVGINDANLYEWFSLQLDKPGTALGQPQSPSEFNIWQIYSDSNSIPYSQAYRMVSALYEDNSQDTNSSFIFERTAYWYDASDKVYYSNAWRFINPLRDVTIDMQPSIDDQVVNVTLFKFWEGSIVLKGIIDNEEVEGLGFAELVAGHDFEIIPPSAPSEISLSEDQGHYMLSWLEATEGTYPLGGYRVFRSSSNKGHWKYIGTTTNLSYTDFSVSIDSDYYYAVSSFDNQTATSASDYSTPAHTSGNNIIDAIPETIFVKIYPNPANEKVNIELDNEKALKWTSIEIKNINGKSLQHFLPKTLKTEIDLQDFSSGIYIIQIKSKDEVCTKKLIKQ